MRPDDQVDVIWQLPKHFATSSEKIGPRFYWDALTTHNWIKEELIPEALKWSNEIHNSSKRSMFSSFIKKAPREPIHRDLSTYVSSYYDPYPEEDIKFIKDIDGLLFLVNRLQSFFHVSPGNFYFSNKEFRDLFSVLLAVMKNSELEDFHYLYHNLSYLHAGNQEELLGAIYQYYQEATSDCTNSFQIDCIFRCMLVSMRDAKCYLHDVEIKSLILLLAPFISLMEDRALLRRQEAILD